MDRSLIVASVVLIITCFLQSWEQKADWFLVELIIKIPTGAISVLLVLLILQQKLLLLQQKSVAHSKGEEISYALCEAIEMLVRQKKEYENKFNSDNLKVSAGTFWNWLHEVQKIEGEAKVLLKKHAERWKFFDIIRPPTILKEMRKMDKRIASLLFEGDWLVVEPPDIKRFDVLQKSLEQILIFLRKREVSTLAICGPLGVGKTTIMRNLIKHTKFARSFDVVLRVSVSAKWGGNSIVQRMQQNICCRLGLALEDDHDTEEVRRSIWAALYVKRYLLLLDDVMEPLDWEKWGIPPANMNDSKVVLTTQLHQVCSLTVDTVVKVSYLSHDEAWSMFQDILKRPNLIEDSKTGPLALRLCKECGGLPLLVETVANAFRLKHNEHDWVDGLYVALYPEGIEEVYNPLKSCYNMLLDDCQKKCFLYAALYPEGCHIDSDQLLECWIVEGLLRSASSHRLITTESLKLAKGVLSRLKDVFLLDEGKTENYVTMHKFAREMALCLLENESKLKHLVKTNGALREPPDEELWIDKNRISLADNELGKLPNSPKCRELSTLFLQNNLGLEEIPEQFFEHMENLRVLDFSDTGILSLPPYIWSLKSLKSLYLCNCKHLKSLFCLEAFNIQGSGLEALDIRGSGIANIPHDIAILRQLRRLRVSMIQSSSAYGTPDVGIAGLSLLEDLVIDVATADYQWSDELMGNIMNAATSLACFKTLKFMFSNYVVHALNVSYGTLRVHAPNGLILCSFIERSRWRNDPGIQQFQLVSGRKSTKHPALACFGKYLKYCDVEGSIYPVDFLSKADAFELVNHKDIKQLSDIGIANINNIRACVVESCVAFETVVNSISEAVLPNLEQLYLKNLPKLKSIYEGSLPHGSLTKITTLVFMSCHLITTIFPSGVLEQLREIQYLEIEECSKVERLFSSAESPDVLPKLWRLKLLNLPKLKEICETNALNWPSLRGVYISGCLELRKLPFNQVNAIKLEVIKANDRWWESLQWPNKEIKEQLEKKCTLSTSSEQKSNSSQKLKAHEQSEYLLEEDSPQSSKVHKHLKLKFPRVQKFNSCFEVPPQRSQYLQDINFHYTAIGYNHPGEGNSPKFSGFHGKDDSIPSFFLEAGEEERVMEQELDLIESSSSKVYDDHTLDLSYKSITSLPEDISKYIAVRELKLKGCPLLMELGPEIGELLTLELLDLEGTEIIRLPKEIAKLVNLKSLKFSLYGYADQFQKTKQIGPIIPKKALSNLLQLNELSIDVTPDGDWWNDEVKTVIDELHCLQVLKTLCLYIPTVDLFRYLIQQTELFIYEASVCFRFTVGYHEERLTSRLPQEVLKEFHDSEKFKKGLKFTNGEEIPIEIKDALEHVNAFLLECHWSINNLLEFGLKTSENLKFCILSECNELQTVIDTKQYNHSGQPILGSLQHLSIHYMKSMQKIWRGPVTKGSLSNLKSLALYTCVSLTTVFKIDMLANLINLEELRIEDCPKIKTLASSNFSESISQDFLPKLKIMLLLELPNLRCIVSGPAIAPKLERLVIFYCPKLRKLSKTEIFSKDLKVLKGDKGWWDALKWYESDVTEADQKYLADKFVQLEEDGDLEEQFVRDKTSRQG